MSDVDNCYRVMYSRGEEVAVLTSIAREDFNEKVISE